MLREGRDVHVLNLEDGHTLWQRVNTTPVPSIAVVGQLVLISADRLTAYGLDGGGQRWQIEDLGPLDAAQPDIAVDGHGDVRACFFRSGKLMLY